jgi:hypothetical protein
MVEMVQTKGGEVDRMALNIKNKEAHKLAEELARLTGESMATAVTIAVRERLDRIRGMQGGSLADRLDCLDDYRYKAG